MGRLYSTLAHPIILVANHSCCRLTDHGLLQIDKDLVPINRRLQTYVEQWDVFVDAWLVIKVSNPAFVFTWRQQAESAMKAAGKTGMSDEQVRISNL